MLKIWFDLFWKMYLIIFFVWNSNIYINSIYWSVNVNVNVNVSRSFIPESDRCQSSGIFILNVFSLLHWGDVSTSGIEPAAGFYNQQRKYKHLFCSCFTSDDFKGTIRTIHHRYRWCVGPVPGPEEVQALQLLPHRVCWLFQSFSSGNSCLLPACQRSL